MPEALAAEELQKLAEQLPNFHESPHLQHLAERKLLPQQHDIPSFENPDFLTGLRRATYGLTKKEQQLIKRQEEALVPFQQEQELKTKLQVMQQFAQSMAPTYEEAQARGIGIPAPMRERQVTFPGSAELPGTFNIDELQPGPAMGFTPSTATSPGIPIREQPSYASTTMPFQEANPQAKLSPQDLRLYEQVIGGHGVMDEGKYVPMQLAKPRPDLIDPVQFLQEVGLHESLGNLPAGTTEKLRKAPPVTSPIPARATQAALTEANRRVLESSKQQGTHTLDDTAVSVVGRSMMDIDNKEIVTPAIRARVQQLVPGASVAVGDNLKQTIGGLKTLIFPTAVAGTKAAATTSATQNTSLVPPDKQSNYIHMDTFANSGRIVYPTSTPDDPFTQAKAATGGWKEITDKQKEAIKSIEIARSTQKTLLDLAHQLIQAKGPGGAFVQGLKTQFGAFIRSNPIASAFMGDRQAFSSWMSRMVEVGVLTQQDIERWASVLPDQRDTVGSAVAKEAVLNMLFDAAELANRRSIVGDVKGLAEAKKSLSEQIAQAAKLYAKGKDRPSAQELYRDEFGK